MVKLHLKYFFKRLLNVLYILGLGVTDANNDRFHSLVPEENINKNNQKAKLDRHLQTLSWIINTEILGNIIAHLF